MNNNDRRVKKTKKALNGALIRLMQENELRNITVRQLIELADVHRATFYSHYHDIYDLYEQLETSIISEIKALVYEQEYDDCEKIFRGLISYIRENSDAAKALLGVYGQKSFLQRLCDMLEINCLNYFYKDATITGKDIRERYIAGYHVRGCVHIITQWIDSDFAMSEDELLGIIINLDENMGKVL